MIFYLKQANVKICTICKVEKKEFNKLFYGTFQMLIPFVLTLQKFLFIQFSFIFIYLTISYGFRRYIQKKFNFIKKEKENKNWSCKMQSLVTFEVLIFSYVILEVLLPFFLLILHVLHLCRIKKFVQSLRNFANVALYFY